jgi:hypothetical protein
MGDDSQEAGGRTHPWSRSVPADTDGKDRMAFQFRLKHEDGTPADPATSKRRCPTGGAGDVIALGPVLNSV